MNQHAKGAFEKAKGAMKNALGKMTGNKRKRSAAGSQQRNIRFGAAPDRSESPERRPLLLKTCWRAWPGAWAAVHPASPVAHCRGRMTRHTVCGPRIEATHGLTPIAPTGCVHGVRTSFLCTAPPVFHAAPHPLAADPACNKRLTASPTCTCCTVTTCGPPARTRCNVRRPD
jgi:hypothetical protein